MRRAAAALLAVIGLSASPQQEKPSITWAKSWIDAVSEATIRNVPIYYTVHKDG